MTPIVTPTSADTSAAKTQTALSSAIWSARGKFAGSADVTRRTALDAASRPPAPPTTPRSRLSTSNCRISRHRLAPSAARTAKLPLAAGVANQLQAHEIGHADEQHARHRAKEHPEHALAVAHDVVEEQRGANGTIGAARSDP